MSLTSRVPWLEAPGYRPKTWNIVRGCAEPCGVACWAVRQAVRSKGRAYTGMVRSAPGGPQWTTTQMLVESKLADPISWREPRFVALSLMGDVLGSRISFEQVAALHGVMAACRQHRFALVTKQAQRLLEFIDWTISYAPDDGATGPGRAMFDGVCDSGGVFPESWDSEEGPPIPVDWPPRNVMHILSVPNQRDADAKIPLLVEANIAWRALSLEPMLETIELDRWLDRIDWIIVGTDSLAGLSVCRKVTRSRVWQTIAPAVEAGVPVFVKGLHLRSEHARDLPGEARFVYSSDPREWPEMFRQRSWPLRFLERTEAV